MFNIKESIEYAKEKGLIKKKTELAPLLWEKSPYKSAYMNLANLINGKSKKIDIVNVEKLCKKLGVSADYLFGLTESPSQESYSEVVKGKAKEIITIAETL